MNNTTKKLFFTLTALASVAAVHTKPTELPITCYPTCTTPSINASFKQATVHTKDAATQTETEEVPRASLSSRLRTMLAFMKMQLYTRQRMLGFLAHQSKNTAFWVADVSYDIFKSAFKDVLKDQAKDLIRKQFKLDKK